MGPEPSLTNELLHTLTRAARDHAPAAFSSSLSAEDMVITDAILTAKLPIDIFMIDTGRLHADTLDLLARVHRKYGYQVRVYKPDSEALAAYITEHGRDAFYESLELRRECCRIRKVEPLKRALAGKQTWITGLRETAGARERLATFQYDDVHGVLKFNPLAHWSPEDVWAYLSTREVPYNRLYEQGYRSIGCAPCTRPTLAHEDERAGRWWWEHGEVKECGLHVDASGRLARAREVA
jgi:phosphoadenosine phosphosulfate reductase